MSLLFNVDIPTFHSGPECGCAESSNAWEGCPTNAHQIDTDTLLTPSEVAALLYVDPKTVSRWASAGKVSSIRTPGGHRRFLKSEILALVVDVHRHEDGRSTRSTLSPSTLPRATTPNDEDGREDSFAAYRTAADEAAVVAQAVAAARSILADEAAAAVISTASAVTSAARTATEAANISRANRARAASAAADGVAHAAAETAVATKLVADGAAARLSDAATDAALIVAAAAANDRDGDRRSVTAAIELAVIVKAAAVAKAEETAAAAATVASAVAAAAADVAFMVSALDRAIESNVARVAAEIQTMATATARQVAVEVDARASRTALLARDAASEATSHHPSDPRRST
jgi:excisionase family DNA binding protein